jgi:tetratricopeptide (TPR) repeat protein
MQVVMVVLLLLASWSLTAQEKMPVTTSSLEAKRLYTEGRDAMELLQFKKSIDLLEEAIAIDPDFALAHLTLALTKTGMTTFEPKELEKAIQGATRVSDGERYFIYYAKAFTEGNQPKMKSQLSEVEKIHEFDERVQTLVGMYHYNNEDYSRALRHFNKALDLNKQYHFAQRMIGYTQMAMNRMQEARNSFKAYINMRPDNAAPYEAYAEYLSRNGKFTPAIRYYEKALEIEPESTDSYKGLADSYLFRGDFWRARENYQNYQTNAFNTNQKFDALMLEASMEMQDENVDRALNILDQYIALAREINRPDYVIYGIANKGFILTESGDTEKGLEQYLLAKQMVETANLPEVSREYLTTLTHLWEFYALASNEDMQKAEMARRKCEELVSAKTNLDHWKLYQVACGIMEIKNGNYKQARLHLSDSYDNMPMVWYYTGLSWEKSANRNKARQWYKKITDHYVNSIDMGTFRNKALAGLEKQ